MQNRIKVILTEFGGIQVVSIPLKIYKESYNTTSIECLVPKRNNEKSILKMYASSRDVLGHRVWTSQTYNLVYEKDIIYNQIEYEIYTAMLPKEFCKENGEIEITFAHYSLTEEDRVEELLTSGTVNLYIDGIGNNNAGVAISPYDSTASKVNKLVKEMKIEQERTANDIPISKAERLPYDTVQDMLNGLNANKVDKVQVEAGKLLLSNGIGGIQASDVGIQEYEDQKGYIDEKHAEQEQRMDRMQEEITANTEDRHIHTNKEILDSYTVQNSELLANVQARHEHANKEILDDVTEAFTTALKGNVEGSITSVELDSNTGIFTFTKNNGEQVKVDTLLEKVIVNFRFDKERQALILISEDGTEQEVELGALLRLYKGTDGAEITVTVDRDNNIGASIKELAVTEGKIGDYAVTDRKIGNGAITEIKLHQTILDKFTQLQAEIEAIKADREQIITDSWLYHHPIGSCILTMGNENPNDRGGEWELVQAGKALWTTQGNDAGQTIEAGLPNIVGQTNDFRNNNNNMNAIRDRHNGAFYSTEEYAFRAQYSGNEYRATRINFDASRSNPIYGRSNTVQPPAVKIRLWKRIA